jgi:hypothetical protein
MGAIMIYLLEKKLCGRNQWTKPTQLHDDPQPSDFDILDMDFSGQCQFIAARQAEHDELYSQIDRTVDSWEGKVEISNPERIDAKVPVVVRINDMGSFILGKIDSCASAHQFSDAVVLFPLGRRPNFEPDSVENDLCVHITEYAKLITASMTSSYWRLRDGTVAFAFPIKPPHG